MSGMFDLVVDQRPDSRPLCALCEHPVESLVCSFGREEETLIARCHGERQVRRIKAFRCNSREEYEEALRHPFFEPEQVRA